MTQKTAYFELIGGEDLATPVIKASPGSLIVGINYESADMGGYRRVAGYERFDGQPAPSEANYWMIQFVNGDSEPVPGDTIDQPGSPGTDSILISYTLDSGSWVGGDAAGTLILREVTGTFVDATDLHKNGGGSRFAVAASTAGVNPETDVALHYTYLAAAIEARRTAIGTVPGGGPIRGVFRFNDEVFAFRDNVGGTQGLLHKSTPSGWSTQDLGAYIDFTLGTAEFLEGETVTDGSGTGDIVAVVVTSGDWSTNDAAGRIHLKNVSGSFAAGIITSASGSATCSGAQTNNELAPGGRYEIVNENFGGASGTRKMYGVNGVNQAFQWDGTGFAFITTGMEGTGYHPSHVVSHKRHLFLSFDSSVQHSSIGNPLEWSVITGAGELATGEKVTSMAPVQGDVLAIFNRNATKLLYGTSTADWNLKNYSISQGAIEWSLQTIGIPFYLDDRGVMNLSTTDKYGDFAASTISKLVNPYLTNMLKNTNASTRVKEKDQYRVFFDGGFGMTGSLVGDEVHFTRFEYPNSVICASEGETSTGDEVIYAGLDNGYVVQLERGNSFDGAEIQAVMRLAFNHLKSPRHKKKFFKAVFETSGANVGEIMDFSADYDFGSGDFQPQIIKSINITAQGGYWDSDIEWGNFVWDSQTVATPEAYLEGHGLNISLIIRSASTYEDTHTVQGMTLHYSVRGLDK